MTRLLKHRFMPLCVVLAALAAVAGLAWLTRPVPPPVHAAPRASHVPVVAATAVCPEPSAASVAVATPPGGGTGGRVEIRQVDGGAALGVVDRRGAVWTRDLPAESGPVVVRATGSLAAGMEVEQTSIDTRGGLQALSATRCAAPDTNLWFLGDAVAFGRMTALYLANVDDTPASVDVDVFSPAGPVDPAGGHGLTVGAHSSKTVPLRQLAAKASIAAVHVRTSIGRVAAAVRTVATSTRVDGPRGADWLPQAAGPGRELVVPGIPGSNNPRRLLLAAPGEDDATAKVQVVTSKGTYVPHGRDSVQVPAGSVTEVKLDGALSGSSAAARISSDVPLVAAAVVEEREDVGYVAAVPALSGGSVVADELADGRVKSSLLLSAPVRDAVVRVQTFGAGGPGAPRTLRIPAGRTVSTRVAVPAGARGSFATVVTPVPGSGPVYGARMLIESSSGGPLFTLLPLVTSPTSVAVPEVVRSLSAAVPAG